LIPEIRDKVKYNALFSGLQILVGYFIGIKMEQLQYDIRKWIAGYQARLVDAPDDERWQKGVEISTKLLRLSDVNNTDLDELQNVIDDLRNNMEHPSWYDLTAIASRMYLILNKSKLNNEQKEQGESE
jgi:hypothetical protein